MPDAIGQMPTNICIPFKTIHKQGMELQFLESCLIIHKKSSILLPILLCIVLLIILSFVLHKHLILILFSSLIKVEDAVMELAADGDKFIFEGKLTNNIKCLIGPLKN